MKKLFSLIVLLSLVLSVASCASKAPSSTAAPSEQAQTNQTTPSQNTPEQTLAAIEKVFNSEEDFKLIDESALSDISSMVPASFLNDLKGSFVGLLTTGDEKSEITITFDDDTAIVKPSDNSPSSFFSLRDGGLYSIVFGEESWMCENMMPGFSLDMFSSLLGDGTSLPTTSIKLPEFKKEYFTIEDDMIILSEQCIRDIILLNIDSFIPSLGESEYLPADQIVSSIKQQLSQVFDELDITIAFDNKNPNELKVLINVANTSTGEFKEMFPEKISIEVLVSSTLTEISIKLPVAKSESVDAGDTTDISAKLSINTVVKGDDVEVTSAELTVVETIKDMPNLTYNAKLTLGNDKADLTFKAVILENDYILEDYDMVPIKVAKAIEITASYEKANGKTTYSITARESDGMDIDTRKSQNITFPTKADKTVFDIKFLLEETSEKVYNMALTMTVENEPPISIEGTLSLNSDPSFSVSLPEDAEAALEEFLSSLTLPDFDDEFYFGDDEYYFE